MVAQVKQYEMLAKQELFYTTCDRVPFTAYIGGFGSGKTHSLAVQALRECTRGPGLGLIGASTYRMLEDTTQRKFFELCPESWIRTFHRSDSRVTMKNGMEILFRSLENPDRLLGLELSWFGLDEIGIVPLDTFRMLQGRLRRKNSSRHGFAVGNPAGPTHWTYDYFVTLAKKHPETYTLIQATTYENTFLPRDYVREMEISFDKKSRYYRRFVLGEFVAFEGAYWPDFNLEVFPAGHVCTRDQIPEILDMRSPLLHCGRVLDFGFEHPFVHMWFITDNERIVFYDEYYARHMTIKEHCWTIMQHNRAHYAEHNITVPGWAWTDHDAQCRAEISACEMNDGTPIGFECNLADKSVMEGILLVQTLIGQNRLFITQDCTNALKEVPAYRAKAQEKSQKEEPIKEKDDSCDCIRMACQCELAHLSLFKRLEDAKRNAIPIPQQFQTQPAGPRSAFAREQ